MLVKGVGVEGSGSRVKVTFHSSAADGFYPYQVLSTGSQGISGLVLWQLSWSCVRIQPVWAKHIAGSSVAFPPEAGQMLTDTEVSSQESCIKKVGKPAVTVITPQYPFTWPLVGQPCGPGCF
ncbi:hypothetical protein ACRRTK_016147 [Alexandromys fortis]